MKPKLFYRFPSAGPFWPPPPQSQFCPPSGTYRDFSMISAVKGLTISSGEEIVKKKKSMPAGGLECLSAWGVVYWKEPAEIRDLLRGAARPRPWLLAPVLGCWGRGKPSAGRRGASGRFPWQWPHTSPFLCPSPEQMYCFIWSRSCAGVAFLLEGENSPDTPSWWCRTNRIISLKPAECNRLAQMGAWGRGGAMGGRWPHERGLPGKGMKGCPQGITGVGSIKGVGGNLHDLIWGSLEEELLSLCLSA